MSTIYSAYPDIADLLPLGSSFDAIPRFPHSAYEVHVSWDYLEDQIAGHTKNYGLNLDPDYQRDHVWTPAQRTAYLEYMLLGGELSRVLVFAAPGWNGNGDVKSYELVDGKQRLESVRGFMRGEVYAFRRKFSDFKGRLRSTLFHFQWRIVDLHKRSDILKLYLSLNIGGTTHDPKEIARVQKLLAAELVKEAA